MYAIVEIAGQQFKVAKDQKVFVNRLREKKETAFLLIMFFLPVMVTILL
jgi:ribosomal protein L21